MLFEVREQFVGLNFFLFSVNSRKLLSSERETLSTGKKYLIDPQRVIAILTADDDGRSTDLI